MSFGQQEMYKTKNVCLLHKRLINLFLQGNETISISPSTGTTTIIDKHGRKVSVSSNGATTTTTKFTINGINPLKVHVPSTQKTIKTKQPMKMAGPTTKTTIQNKQPQKQNPRTEPSISILPLASPPFPPMWSERCTETIESLATYKLFPVDTKTLEYSTIAELLYPAEILTVEQIVNPTLWSRFVKTRKDMLHLKSDDTELLSQLQLSEAELMASYQYSLNFTKDSTLSAVPYNDNMVLLFHCTRRSENIENILRQGLDVS